MLGWYNDIFSKKIENEQAFSFPLWLGVENVMPSLQPFKCHETLSQCEELNTVVLVSFAKDAVTTRQVTQHAPCKVLCVSGLWTFCHVFFLHSMMLCLEQFLHVNRMQPSPQLAPVTFKSHLGIYSEQGQSSSFIGCLLHCSQDKCPQIDKHACNTSIPKE
jgi:hypothetical protein